LNAPAGSGGKLVTGQIPNISISSTSVVADAAERLALDVQEGDVAIQTNVSSSFIFTGGDNVAPNWQIIDFDAVGAIAGEDITPANVNASGNISMQDLTVAGAINGAETSAAAAGEALTSNGSGSLQFASVGGDALTQMSDFLSQSNMSQIASSQSDMQDVINTGLIQNVAASQTAMQEIVASQTAIQEVVNSLTALVDVTESQTAMQEVANSQTAMQEVANSQTAMQKVATSQTAMQEVATSRIAMEEVAASNTAKNEILNSPTQINLLTTSFSFSQTKPLNSDQREVIPETDESFPIYIKSAGYTGDTSFRTNTQGWYNRSGNYLGKNIGPIFVDQLTIGWNSNYGGSDVGGLSGDIEALIF